MVAKRALDQKVVDQALDAFLRAKQDEHSVNHLEQRMEIHVAGTSAYIPTYTRSVMDQNYGATVMAIHTKTDFPSKKVFFYPADDPKAKGARKLRTPESMGPALVAFGVPLRKLKLKYKVSRRLILPVYTLEVPDQGTTYWVSFADIEMEARDVDLEAINAAKKAKATEAKARKTTRAKKTDTNSAPAESA